MWKVIHVIYTKKSYKFLKRLVPKIGRHITIFYMFLNTDPPVILWNSRNLRELFNWTIIQPEQWPDHEYSCVNHARLKKRTTSSILEAPQPWLHTPTSAPTLPPTKATTILTPHSTVAFQYRFSMCILNMRKLGLRNCSDSSTLTILQLLGPVLTPSPMPCLLSHTATFSFHFLKNRGDYVLYLLFVSL